eukprot:TRINITY_DN6211_c0_g1_i1.p1 TRINITY_DN6211_c0_g1~~TRINITY_DN6211_c0_g1_i1.p1  ORF type:complete len:150 (+),score=15.44 TRINITY_DN6211_c0_g1_i1:92-541(+)
MAGRSSSRKILMGTGLLMIALTVLNSLLSTSQLGYTLRCIDNSGATKLKVMGVIGQTRKPNLRRLRPGDVCVVVGSTQPGVKNKVMKGIVVRTITQSSHPLANGFKTSFDTNCAVLIDGAGNPIGSRIKGEIDIRCALLWPKLAAIARK